VLGESFQSQCMKTSKIKHSKTSKIKYTRTLIVSFQSNEASYLEHIAPIIIFSIYSVELELHDRKVCFAHLCYGLTRIELSSLENHNKYLGSRHRLRIAWPSISWSRFG
jgi:hypothetical protein